MKPERSGVTMVDAQDVKPRQSIRVHTFAVRVVHVSEQGGQTRIAYIDRDGRKDKIFLSHTAKVPVYGMTR